MEVFGERRKLNAIQNICKTDRLNQSYAADPSDIDNDG